jgi:hypothetical protein
VETLMFFLDPSGNVLELTCQRGYPGAKDLPLWPLAQGLGNTLDIDAISYSIWKIPGAVF